MVAIFPNRLHQIKAQRLTSCWCAPNALMQLKMDFVKDEIEMTWFRNKVSTGNIHIL